MTAVGIAKFSKRAATLISVLFVFAGTVGLLVGNSASASTAPRITSVIITGSQAAPWITINGQNLGKKPKANPSRVPMDFGKCIVHPPPKKLALVGYDYGINLFMQDSSSKPIWGAGRYRAGEIGGLDCVGIVVTKFTSRTVTFRLGEAYPKYPGVPASYHLVAGDHFSVQVNGTTFSGRVRYR